MIASAHITHGSLFSGIGGFDLGFERAGIETIWQVECEDYCRRVLARHFPSAKRYDDVRTVGKHNLARVDIISGGFPCQDISNAGKRVGIDGERSGLWSEYARIIRELRPRYVVVENVAALLGRGMERVLGDLAACGYDAEWQSIRASDIGAPHRRERIWIIAYPTSDLWRTSRDARSESLNRSDSHVANAERCWRRKPTRDFDAVQESFCAPERGESPFVAGPSSKDLAYAEVLSGELRPATRERQGRLASGSVSHAIEQGLERNECGILARPGDRRLDADITGPSWWAIEPNVGRVAHGVPKRVDRLKGLGNAIVPQIAEWIGRRLTAAVAMPDESPLFCQKPSITKEDHAPSRKT